MASQLADQIKTEKLMEERPKVPMAVNLEPDKKPKPFVKYIFIFLFMLALGGVGVWYFVFSDKKITITDKGLQSSEKSQMGPVRVNSNQAYYVLSSNMENIDKDDEIELTVQIVTSGEAFDLGAVIIEWSSKEFKHISSTPVKVTDSANTLDTFVGKSRNRRILTQYVPVQKPPAEPMITEKNMLTDFYVVKLKALVDSPTKPVKLASSENDVIVHFVDSEVNNSVDQTLLDLENTQISF
jgi:hypothetical protein